MAPSFGQRSSGLQGRIYDSLSESVVAKHLFDLQGEGVITGFLEHVLLAGMNVDFLVRTGINGPSGRVGSLIGIEYDGMGISRPRSLAPKLERFSHTALYGVPVHWLHDNSYEGVRACILDYTPPPFITKKRVCPCGRVTETLLVAARPQDLARIGAHTVEYEESTDCSEGCAT